MTRREVVELVSDYLADAWARVPASRRTCRSARAAHRLHRPDPLNGRGGGAAAEEDLEPQIREELLEAFRDWFRSARPSGAV